MVYADRTVDMTTDPRLQIQPAAASDLLAVAVVNGRPQLLTNASSTARPTGGMVLVHFAFTHVAVATVVPVTVAVTVAVPVASRPRRRS